ncbi:hypothetical protein [Butyrivibrio sp. NC2002]|uniref:hypothetical protein n=1 Tax=Butyrivibrio sp. NC2002 TaxID=1410610 RepID=UPI0005632C4D|nr:hypothetical protein [Butyrivibrio sp. NC2002]
MVGKYDIRVYNNRVSYHFVIKRNITIIQGDSGTGKTSLFNLISDYNQSGISSGVTVSCDRKCVTLRLNDELQTELLKAMHGYIVFLDENSSFVKTHEFAKIANKSDNYFVIICRDSLPQLSYSVEEIYGIRVDRDAKKYRDPHRVYNEMYKLYNFDGTSLKPEVVITEDSNSGHDCFARIFPKSCISAGGRSNVVNMISSLKIEHKDVLAIVDGAAFGSEVELFLRKAENYGAKCVLYAPESFEYILLKSGILGDRVDSDKLAKTYDYADSCKYVSWEQFYEAYLTDISQGTVYSYSKKKLGLPYMTDGNMKKILNQLPKQIEV